MSFVGKKYKSGACKRKARHQKTRELEKIPKLQTFFGTTSSESNKQIVVDSKTSISEINKNDENVINSKENEDQCAIFNENPLPHQSNNSTCVYINETDNIDSDIALWPSSINDVTINECILKKGFHFFQNYDNTGYYEKSVRSYNTQNRKLSNKLFNISLSNGEIIRRSWLCYSPSSGNVYCIVCKLFKPNYNSFCTGFSDWKRGQDKIEAHENNPDHRKCMFIWVERSKTSKHIDVILDQSFLKEKEYWTNVLKRILAVVIFLAERGLPFRGDTEVLGSPRNGNFLGILELMALFDPFLKNHLEKYGNKGSGCVSYLSKTIYEEFIELIGERVKEKIIAEVKEAIYFGLVVDSTPDLTHVDQLSIVIRYCLKGNVYERFLGYLPVYSHAGASLSESVINYLQKNGIDIKYCYGQSYDNASNMSGKYSGMQAAIKQVSKHAHYIPCVAHSLNLIGKCSVEECLQTIKFFMFLQKLYTFFSGSTHRWNILIKHISEGKGTVTLKSLSQTRWSCREDAVKALAMGYSYIYRALLEINGNNDERKENAIECQSLIKYIKRLETAFMTVFWDETLREFGKIGKTLQEPGLDVNTAYELLKSLHMTLSKKRDNFKTYLNRAKKLDDIVNCEFEQKRLDKTNKFPDGATVNLLGSEKFRIQCYLVTVDKLCQEIEKRSNAYSEVVKLFGFFRNIVDMDKTELEHCGKRLINEYYSDINNDFIGELFFLQDFLKSSYKEKYVSPTILIKMIIEKDVVPVFPNLYIILRIFLSMPITNCESERSFSTLGYIKNKFRTVMSDERLSHLSLCCIESNILRSLEYDDIIENFVNRKIRKKL